MATTKSIVIDDGLDAEIMKAAKKLEIGRSEFLRVAAREKLAIMKKPGQ